MKILLVIPSLERGGAEGQLVLLANALARRGHEVGVVALAGGGALETRLENVRLLCLGKTSKADLPRTLAALVGVLRRERPDILHGYLPTANVLAALAGIFCPQVAVVFGLRVSNMDLGELGLAGRLMYRLERVLARRARLVIANSEAGRAHALACGFAKSRLAVVHNAVDPGLKPDPEACARLRAQWGVTPGQRLVGVVARLDPMKDQLGFVQAASVLAGMRQDVRFVLVGGGLPDYTQRVRSRIAELGLDQRMTLVGKRDDMPAVYSALDLLCLPSAFGEGFPNVLSEAMACGVACCATDVGDAAAILGELGTVVPPREPNALVNGITGLLERLDCEGEGLRSACRERIAKNFSVERMVEDTETLLARLCREAPP